MLWQLTFGSHVTWTKGHKVLLICGLLHYYLTLNFQCLVLSEAQVRRRSLCLSNQICKTYNNLIQFITLIQKLVVFSYLSVCAQNCPLKVMLFYLFIFPYSDCLVGFYASSSFQFGANCCYELVNYYACTRHDNFFDNILPLTLNCMGATSSFF